jgi:hypothetical protein
MALRPIQSHYNDLGKREIDPHEPFFPFYPVFPAALAF